MADLTNLNLTPESAEVDYDKYVDPTEFAPPIPAGVYTFRQGKPEFSATEKGYLSAVMTQTVVGGEVDGKTVNFDRVSDKPFERQGVKVSMAVDHVRALGDTARYRTHEEFARAIEAGEGRIFKAQADWEAYCNPNDGGCGNSVKGERNFPLAGDGKTRLNQVNCPKCGKVDLFGNARIVRRIPA